MKIAAQRNLSDNALSAFDEAWHHHFHRLIFEGSRLPLRAILPLLSGKRSKPSPEFLYKLREELSELIARDIQNVNDGYYPKSTLRFPLKSYLYSTLTSNPLDGLRVLKRAKNNNWKELPTHANKHAYPDYYLRTFHWQTDGWFSERSAKRYDASVQFLFGGVADIMRRMALPPVAKSIHNKHKPIIVELACGTGSFLPQIHSAFPNAIVFGIDLSPDYINYARKKITHPNIRLIQRNVESLPFDDNSVDAIICNNLFHELPPVIRRHIFHEVHRVLKVDAVFSLTDSVQQGDSQIMAESISNFSSLFHEPFHKNHIQDDLKSIFVECGFEPSNAQTNVFSKSIFGVKHEQ
ncbi:hypothetical protein A9Q99_06925 [Gammaproteobacteria bacterium 45_16_T64]|nr:hypothetical protein A9Q99_06925 [Gammaproteobacteria bacterium 45_16_T64]